MRRCTQLINLKDEVLKDGEPRQRVMLFRCYDRCRVFLEGKNGTIKKRAVRRRV